MTESTFEILKMFFGLAQGRSVRKRDLQDELIKRGVSPYGIRDVLNDILFQIGNAADNRIEEIDMQTDEPHPEMEEIYPQPDEEDSLDDVKRDYVFGLTESEVVRCFDCKHIDLGLGGFSGRCGLLDIGVANILKSWCRRWEK